MTGAIVRQFTHAALLAQEKEIPRFARKPSKEEIAFIRKMINDELDELEEAYTIGDIADAGADLMIYTADWYARLGIDIDAFIRIAHAANMNKIVDGQVQIEKEGPRKGKILKPEGWEDPTPLVHDEGYRQALGTYQSKTGLVYVASPYSHPDDSTMAERYSEVMDLIYTLSMAFPDAFFSPILHYHPVALTNDMEKSYGYWRNINHAYMRRCDRMICACIDGWEESLGVKGELEYAKEIGLAVTYTSKEEGGWAFRNTPPESAGA